jgi:hypothetical protein
MNTEYKDKYLKYKKKYTELKIQIAGMGFRFTPNAGKCKNYLATAYNPPTKKGMMANREKAKYNKCKKWKEAADKATQAAKDAADKVKKDAADKAKKAAETELNIQKEKADKYNVCDAIIALTGRNKVRFDYQLTTLKAGKQFYRTFMPLNIVKREKGQPPAKDQYFYYFKNTAGEVKKNITDQVNKCELVLEPVKVIVPEELTWDYNTWKKKFDAIIKLNSLDSATYFRNNNKGYLRKSKIVGTAQQNQLIKSLDDQIDTLRQANKEKWSNNYQKGLKKRANMRQLESNSK